MPSLSLQRAAGRKLLAGRRCQEHRWPLDVRTPEPRCIRQTRRRQMDRRGHRRARRSARRHPQKAAASSISATWPAKQDASSGCHDLNRTTAAASIRRHRLDRRSRRPGVPRNRHGGYSRCRSRSRARWRKSYLRDRGITALRDCASLRFHPRCYYRPDPYEPTETWPAMIAAVTDLDGRITGAHRTYLNPQGFDRSASGKAPIDTPRRAMGHLLGNAVRFGVADDVMAAGEGIETMLSLRCVLPDMPMAAALSAAHLASHSPSGHPAPPLYRSRRRSRRR